MKKRESLGEVLKKICELELSQEEHPSEAGKQSLEFYTELRDGWEFTQGVPELARFNLGVIKTTLALHLQRLKDREKELRELQFMDGIVSDYISELDTCRKIVKDVNILGRDS